MMAQREEERGRNGPAKLYGMNPSEIASGGYELFPKLSTESKSEILRLMDEAWVISVREGRSADFAREAFPPRIAEGLRATIIAASAELGDELGPVVERAAKLGYWLERPRRVTKPKYRLRIWRIDQCHELLGCRPAAVLSTLRDADAWIAQAPRHEFRGLDDTAHDRLRYLSARRRWLEEGGEWAWPPATVGRVRGD